MDLDHAARVLAYQRGLAVVRVRLVRYSHGDDAAHRLALSVRDSQAAAATSQLRARPTRPDDR